MGRKDSMRVLTMKAGGILSLLAACSVVVSYIKVVGFRSCAGVGRFVSPETESGVLEGIVTTNEGQLVLKDEAVDVQDREWDKQEANIHVRLKTVGVGSFLFIELGAYRGGTNTFAVVGMGPKALHDHANPGFECEWISSSGRTVVKASNVTKYIPDFGLSHQYSAVVVNCTFGVDVGTDQEGGELRVVANHGTSNNTGLPDARFVALKEEPGECNASLWAENVVYPYDYVYCGSPLFGNISPQRVREWMAYHAWFFGNTTLFLIYDAGGIEGDVRKILNPWIKVGRVKVVNVRQQERFDGHYHNQFVTLNDCLFRARTLAKWAFTFDVDEYLMTAKERTFTQAMEEISRENTQIVFGQNPMSVNLCNDKSHDASQWLIEKLVYKYLNLSEEERHFDTKYAVQPRYAFSAGVHRSTSFIGNPRWDAWLLKYYHYHNTIDHRTELCTRFVDSANNTTVIDNIHYEMDSSVADVLEDVRHYELQQVGSQPFIL